MIEKVPSFIRFGGSYSYYGTDSTDLMNEENISSNDNNYV